MPHIVLLGDSIFDNARYVRPGEPDVTAQVQSLLPKGSIATRLALDGDVVAGVPGQLDRLPEGASHLFISVGGNDALGTFAALTLPAKTIADALLMLSKMRDDFEAAYTRMLEKAIQAGIPITLCSIYYPRFNAKSLERVEDILTDPKEAARTQKIAMAGLAVFNDVITLAAFKAGVPLIDLRALCSEDEDFANPIEPSAKGGQKMAACIKDVALSHDFSQRRSVVYCSV